LLVNAWGMKPEVSARSRFTAIDFETANCKRNSACAVAMVRVESGRIVDRVARLIRPPESSFSFSHVHGITWKSVSNEPAFAEVWSSLSCITQNIDFLVAHNASFDKAVLNGCCEHSGIRPPDLPFHCTVLLSRRYFNLGSVSLPCVCRHLGISLSHHDPASDAEACARIMLAVLQHERIGTVVNAR